MPKQLTVALPVLAEVIIDRCAEIVEELNHPPPAPQFGSPSERRTKSLVVFSCMACAMAGPVPVPPSGWSDEIQARAWFLVGSSAGWSELFQGYMLQS